MGFDFDRVVAQSKEFVSQLKCLICLDVVKDAVQLMCCQQLFCRKCIEEWLTHHNNPNVGNCPFDRTRITRRKMLEVPPIVNRLLDTLTIKCQYIRNGCKTICKLSQLEEHEKRCHYRNGVPIKFEDKKLVKHQTLITKKNCDFVFWLLLVFLILLVLFWVFNIEVTLNLRPKCIL